MLEKCTPPAKWGAAEAFGIIIRVLCQQKAPSDLDGAFCWYRYLEVGFERRLLASVRWTLATAVAFPQKSESVLPHHKTWSFGFRSCFFISDSNHKIAIVRWTMAHARPDGHDTLLLPIHASLIRNSGVSFLYGHSSRKDELTFKSRQKQDYTIIEILIFTPFRKWWKSVINHRILLQKCRNRVHSVSYHF